MSTADLERVGVLYSHQPALEGVNALAAERGYRNRDEITVSPEKMGDVYEEKVRSFFHEHLHEDEEIRYIRDGHGYFDVRSQGDEWIRIHLEKASRLPLPLPQARMLVLCGGGSDGGGAGGVPWDGGNRMRPPLLVEDQTSVNWIPWESARTNGSRTT